MLCINALQLFHLEIDLEETYFMHNFRVLHMPKIPNLNISSLPLSLFIFNPNVTSRYPMNSSAVEIENKLALEEWNDNINYELYYSNCHPISCFYTISKNLHIPTIVTTVIGLVGGLSVILGISIPPIIKIYSKHRRINGENGRVAFQGR